MKLRISAIEGSNTKSGRMARRDGRVLGVEFTVGDDMRSEIVDKFNIIGNNVELINESPMKKPTTHLAPVDDTARTTFVSLMTLFGTAQQLIKDRMRVAQVDGLGPLHLRLLCLCVEQPGGTQQQLANLTGRDKGQVAHLIHALEARGLMARTPDALDGRLLRMSVTPAGADEVHRFMAIETELAQHLFGALAAGEVEQLQTWVHQLLQRATTCPDTA